MAEIHIEDIDFLQAARGRASEEPLFALQVKCMALIRMLEERDRAYAELEKKYQEAVGEE